MGTTGPTCDVRGPHSDPAGFLPVHLASKAQLHPSPPRGLSGLSSTLLELCLEDPAFFEPCPVAFCHIEAPKGWGRWLTSHSSCSGSHGALLRVRTLY